jgi:hypothetical protein
MLCPFLVYIFHIVIYGNVYGAFFSHGKLKHMHFVCALYFTTFGALGVAGSITCPILKSKVNDLTEVLLLFSVIVDDDDDDG